jgi:hypothetical protein
MWKIGAALSLCLASVSLLGQTGFGAIRIGEPVAILPFPCTGAVFCEGEYLSSWVSVDGYGGIINGIDIIYSGSSATVDPTTLGPLVIKSSPITLAQAVKLHSLQTGAIPPVFGLAKDNHGKTYGIVDISNRIAYTASGSSADSQVDRVVYLGSDAPVLKTAARSKLATSGDPLLQAARSSEPYANLLAISPGRVEDTPLSTRKAANHNEAAEGVQERSDTVIGSGKMVLALIEQVSTWYTVDKDHPTAIAKSEELRRMHPKFLTSWRDLILYSDANKSLLLSEDVEKIPFDLNKDVESKMRQLKAMGFEE